MDEVTSAVQSINTERSTQSDQLETATVQQLTALDNNTRRLIQELNASLEAVRVAQRSDAHRLETDVIARLHRSLATTVSHCWSL